MRALCKKINNVKDSLLFAVQMNVVAGYGLAVQFALPYLETGTDWNLTCMLYTLLGIVAELGRKRCLPKDLKVLTDGGDGNWSVATCCFYALLVICESIGRLTVNNHTMHTK